MARFPYLNPEDLPESARGLLSRPIALNRELVHSPGAAAAVHSVGHWIRHESTLDSRLRELGILAVGWLARAPYEWSHHIKIGRDFGVNDDDIRALIGYLEHHESDNLDLTDRAVLDAARELHVGTELGDETFAKLNQELSHEHVVDLVVTISFYQCVVRVLGSLQIDVEPEYEPYLAEFPLPS
jgi:alkylhydroperoxidase family enzyme